MWRIYLVASIFVCVIAIPYNGRKTDGIAVEEVENGLFDTYQAILDQGYPAETHHVTTHDGYILELTRIPHGKNETQGGTRSVVFLMHGILAAANSFIILGSEYSIAYHLADAGFDIWMGNARGNYYSRFHVTLDPDDDVDKFEFFDFTFEEIGMYDVTAMIDYALQQTGRDQLHYIGHSQGGTVFLVLSTMRPEYNAKIKSAHLLAAVGYQDHFPNTQLTTAARLVDTLYAVALLEGLVEYFPLDLSGEEKRSYNPDNCFGSVKYRNLCYLMGFRGGLLDISTGTENLLAGASVKQLAHFGQNIRDRAFRRWHYGSITNNEIYGTPDPPIYDLNLITTYVTMHYSLNDSLLDERDVLAMANDIQKAKVHRVARETFLHEEYVTGTDAKEMVTDFIIEDILKVEAGNFEDWEIAVDENVDIDEGGQEGDEVINENEVDIDENVDESDSQDVDGPLSPGSASGVTLSTLVQIYLIVISILVLSS